MPASDNPLTWPSAWDVLPTAVGIPVPGYRLPGYKSLNTYFRIGIQDDSPGDKLWGIYSFSCSHT